MADNRRNLRVDITSQADTSGFDKTSQAGRKLQRDVTGSAKATDRLEQSQKKLDDQAKKLAGSGGSLQKMQHSLRALAIQMPLLGRAAELMISPIALAIGAAVVTFTKLKRSIQENTDLLTSLGNSAARRIGDYREELRKAREEADLATDSISRHEAALSEAFQKGRTRASDRVEALRLEYDAIERVANAEMQLQLAQAGSDEERAAISSRFAAFTGQRGQQQRQDTVAVKQEELNRRLFENRGLKQAADAAAAAVTDPARVAKLTNLDKQIADLQARKAEEEKIAGGLDFDKIAQRWAAEQHRYRFAVSPPPDTYFGIPTSYGRAKSAYNTAVQARGAPGLTQGEIDRLTDVRTGLRREDADLKARAQSAQLAYESNAAAAASLRQEQNFSYSQNRVLAASETAVQSRQVLRDLAQSTGDLGQSAQAMAVALQNVRKADEMLRQELDAMNRRYLTRPE